MKFLIVKNERIVFGLLARGAAAADRAADMGEKRDLLVVASHILGAGNLLVGEKGRLTGAVQHDPGGDVFLSAIRVANPDAGERPVLLQSFDRSAAKNLRPTIDGFLQHHPVKLAPAHLPRRTVVEVPIRVA